MERQNWRVEIFYSIHRDYTISPINEESFNPDIEDYQDFSAWQKDIRRANSVEDGNGEFAGTFAISIYRLAKDSRVFYEQETDVTNKFKNNSMGQNIVEQNCQ